MITHREKVLFVVRAYNDIDNLCPLINHFILDQRYDVEVICSNPAYKIQEHHLYPFITETLRVPFYYCVRFIKNPFVKFWMNLNLYVGFFLSFNGMVEKNLKRKIEFNEDVFLRYLQVNRFFLIITDEAIIYKNPKPHFLKTVQNVVARNKLKIACFQTGQNPFDMHSFIIEGVDSSKFEKFPDQFKMYFPYQQDLERYAKYGIDRSYLQCFGSIRYSPAWIEKLKNIFNTPINSKNKKNILLLLTKLRYGVNKKLLLQTIDELSQLKNVTLVIKPHTRGMESGLLNNAKNVVVDQKTSTTQLIDNCDICLFMGSSMGTQVLVEKKILVSLNYLQGYVDFFTTYQACYSIENIKDLVLEVEMLLLKGAPKPVEVTDKFLNYFIYGENGPSHVINAVFEEIISRKDEK